MEGLGYIWCMGKSEIKFNDALKSEPARRYKLFTDKKETPLTAKESKNRVKDILAGFMEGEESFK